MKRKYLKYIFLFVIFFLVLSYFYIPFRVDTYADYGFSFALTNGQIPYKEYNPIVPLFSPFLYSIFLFINKSMLTFFIEQCFLLCFFSYLLFKLLDKKAWIVITLLLCPYISLPFCLFPGYNFLVLLEIVLLLYLEENNKDDRLIGIVSGLCILTKQNIGAFIYLLMIIYPLIKTKKINKSIKRLLYSLIPIIIFITYLLITNSFMNFIDLCFLGLIDFKNNFYGEKLCVIIVITTLIIMIIKYIKTDNKNFSYYIYPIYLLFVYPIIDPHHTAIYLLLFIITFLYNTNIKLDSKKLIISSVSAIVLFIGSFTYLFIDYFSILNIYSYKYFPIDLRSKSQHDTYEKIIKFSKDKNVKFIGDTSTNMFFSANTNKKLNMYFVLLNGNHGYHGLDKLKKSIKNEKDCYFIVSNNIDVESESSQYIVEIPNMVRKYKHIKDIGSFSIYYKE